MGRMLGCSSWAATSASAKTTPVTGAVIGRCPSLSCLIATLRLEHPPAPRGVGPGREPAAADLLAELVAGLHDAPGARRARSRPCPVWRCPHGPRSHRPRWHRPGLGRRRRGRRRARRAPACRAGSPPAARARRAPACRAGSPPQRGLGDRARAGRRAENRPLRAYPVPAGRAEQAANTEEDAIAAARSRSAVSEESVMRACDAPVAAAIRPQARADVQRGRRHGDDDQGAVRDDLRDAVCGGGLTRRLLLAFGYSGTGTRAAPSRTRRAPAATALRDSPRPCSGAKYDGRSARRPGTMASPGGAPAGCAQIGAGSAPVGATAPGRQGAMTVRDYDSAPIGSSRMATAAGPAARRRTTSDVVLAPNAAMPAPDHGEPVTRTGYQRCTRRRCIRMRKMEPLSCMDWRSSGRCSHPDCGLRISHRWLPGIPPSNPTATPAMHVKDCGAGPARVPPCGAPGSARRSVTHPSSASHFPRHAL